jgi:hypothetical protein
VIDLAALRAVALAATPGPWPVAVWIETDGNEWRATGPGHDDSDDGSEPGCPDEQAAQADARYLNAFSPSTALALLDELGELRHALDMALGPHCPHCANPIDADVCHCGEYVKNHGGGDGHSPVPMGCACGYDPDWESLAKARGVLLSKLRAELAAVRVPMDQICRDENLLPGTTVQDILRAQLVEFSARMQREAELAAMTAARDEACTSLQDHVNSQHSHAELALCKRNVELRAVGRSKGTP